MAAPGGAPQSSAQEGPPPASSSLNIAIQDSKDFPQEALQELFSEFTMADGRALFECQNLVKAPGIDLMNCPLDVVLKLRVRRRMQQGSTVLWHVVLPLKQISKYLLNLPHEWETWIGLFPSTQILEAHPPETMFTQAVHLISRPEFPKLRMRFTYTNPELQAQISARCEMEQQESRRRVEHTQNVGRKQFEELAKLTRGLRGPSGDGAGEQPGSGSASAVAAVPHAEASPHSPGQQGGGGGGGGASTEAVRETLGSALAFINSVQQMLALHPRRGVGAPELPPPLSCEELLKGSAPGPSLDGHCMQLHQCLCALAFADPGGGKPPAPTPAPAPSEADVTEGLRLALLGLALDDGNQAQARAPQAADTSLQRLRRTAPVFWEALREVSQVARERATLMEQLGRPVDFSAPRAEELSQRQYAPAPPRPA